MRLARWPRDAAEGRNANELLLSAFYHAFGVARETIVYNRLNQARELVKAQAATGLFA